MSERQAKRLRRAQRAYIHHNKPSLAKGVAAYVAAFERGAIVRQLWPRLNHRGRGVVGAQLAGHKIWITHIHTGHMFTARTREPNLDGALRALGIAVPS